MSNHTHVIMEICRIDLTIASRLFKVTQGRWNLHGSIGNLSLISKRAVPWAHLVPFPRWTAMSVENAHFPTPCIYRPHEEFLLEFCNGGSPQKTRVMPYQTVQRVWRCVRSFRYNIRVWRSDGQTDGRYLLS